MPTDAPAKKRPCRGRLSHAGTLTVRNRNAARFAPMNSLSVDVFLEIVCLLDPRDLLHLSRVSKCIRSILLSRRHRSLWTNALRRIDPYLPPCPDDMSEPLYAALLFDRICFLCAVNRSTHVDYALRLRLCTACYKANVWTGRCFLRVEGLSRWDDYYFALVPCQLSGYGGSMNMERWENALHKVKGKENPLNHKASDRYFVPALEAVMAKYWSLPEGSDAEKAFCAAQEAKTKKIHECATKLVFWEQRCRLMKAIDDKMVQIDRLTSIHAKLEELGHPQTDWPNTPAWTQLMVQKRPLTDRIWNNIRPKLLVMIEEERQRRVEEARQQRIIQRMVRILHLYEDFVETSIPPDARPFTPNVYNTSQLPSLMELARSNDEQTDVTSEELLAVAPQMLDDIDAYKERVHAHMLGRMCRDPIVRADLESEGVAPEAAMQRHYALFACSSCSPPFSLQRPDIMTWAEVNAHWRTTHPDKSWFPDQRKTYESDVPRWAGNPAYSAKMLDGAGIPRDTPLGTLDALVRAGRLYCACGDPELPLPGPDSELCWKLLERHVLHHCLQYERRKKALREDLPIRGLALRETHVLDGTDCCVKYTPPPADPSQAASVRLTIAPDLRARIEVRLQAWPEPWAAAICRVCQRLTKRRRVSKPVVDGGMRLPGTPEGIVWHLRSWHGKEFKEGDIAFTEDFCVVLW